MFCGAYFLIRLPFEISLLLSVIVSSTDAPAVFTVLRNSNICIDSRDKSLLELESASNDPMAVFLTMAALTMVTRPETAASELGLFFVRQMFIGVALGLALGRLAVYILQKSHIPYPGLYPVYGISSAFLVYSLTQLAGGSGILAVYIAGIIVGNSAFLYRRHLIRFNDSLSWIMQISMFLILGLLVNPHELIGVMPAGFACTLFLMFIARWAGLKGAVPIILATYPLMKGVINAQYIFNLIFFLVIISVLFQGKTLPWLARYLQHRFTPLEEKLAASEANDNNDHTDKQEKDAAGA